MSKLNNGEPAFPCGDYKASRGAGMSLRDWFAGQALMGYLATYKWMTCELAATMAFLHADAMLKEREAE